MISVSLVCLNESKKLEKCLSSIKGFAEEIEIIDLGSTDTSQQVYKKYNAEVYHHPRVAYVELVRNYSISKASGDWILVLDPDEYLGEELKEKLKEIVKDNRFSAVNISRKNIFFGKWISHGNWWPDKHVRFFKKGQVRWSEMIHKYPEVSGEILDLPAKEELAIRHIGYQTISEFMERQSRYSEVESKNMFDNKIKFSLWHIFWKPCREFLVRYIKHKGFLDGFYGFALTFLMMIYQLQVMIKLWEREQKK